MKFERTKDGQLLDDISVGRKTFYALSGIWAHVPLITGWVWSPLHYQSNHAGYMANLDRSNLDRSNLQSWSKLSAQFVLIPLPPLQCCFFTVSKIKIRSSIPGHVSTLSGGNQTVLKHAQHCNGGREISTNCPESFDQDCLRKEFLDNWSQARPSSLNLIRELSLMVKQYIAPV